MPASACRRNMSARDYRERTWAAYWMGAKRRGRRIGCRCDYCVPAKRRRRANEKLKALRFEERAG